MDAAIAVATNYIRDVIIDENDYDEDEDDDAIPKPSEIHNSLTETQDFEDYPFRWAIEEVEFCDYRQASHKRKRDITLT